MYEIERQDKAVIIRKGGHVIYSATPDSYLAYRSGDDQLVSQVKDLTNDELLLALVNAIEISPNRKAGLSLHYLFGQLCEYLRLVLRPLSRSEPLAQASQLRPLGIWFIYLIVFGALSLSSVFFPFFYHDEVQTIGIGGPPGAFMMATGRPLHYLLLYAIHLTVQSGLSLKLFGVYRLVGAVFLATIATQLFLLTRFLVAPDRRPGPFDLAFRFCLPILIGSLPGCMEYVIMVQGVPILLGVIASLVSLNLILREAAKPGRYPVEWGVALAALLLILTSAFLYQGTIQICFVGLAVVTLFSDGHHFSTVLKGFGVVLAVMMAASVIYLFLHRVLLSHGYFLYGLDVMQQMRLGERSVHVDWMSLYSRQFATFVMFGTFGDALKLWFVRAHPAAIASFCIVGILVTLCVIVRGVDIRDRLRCISPDDAGGNAAASKWPPLTEWLRRWSLVYICIVLYISLSACVIGTQFVLLAGYPATSGTVAFARVTWYESAVILVLCVYLLSRLGTVVRSRTVQRGGIWALSVCVAGLLVYEGVFWWEARIAPNHREYEFVKRKLTAAKGSSQPVIVVLLPSGSEAVERVLGPAVTDEFFRVTSQGPDGLAQIVAADEGVKLGTVIDIPSGGQGGEIARASWRQASPSPESGVVIMDFGELWPDVSGRHDLAELPSTIRVGGRFRKAMLKEGTVYPLLFLGREGLADMVGMVRTGERLDIVIDQWGVGGRLMIGAPPDYSQVRADAGVLEGEQSDLEIAVDYRASEIAWRIGSTVGRRRFRMLLSMADRTAYVASNPFKGTSTFAVGSFSNVVALERIGPPRLLK